MQRFVAERIEANWDSNQLRIDCLYRRFEIAAGALAAEILLWILKLS